MTPEAELRHANYHNLYRRADGKWCWRWDINLLQWRRRNRSAPGDLYTYLQRIRCPTLLIRDQRSPLLTPGRWSGAGHMPNMAVPLTLPAHTVNADNAPEFNAVTAAFLKE